MRKLPPSGEVITLSAADPLNLVGIVVPGDKVPAISGRYVRFKDGVFVSGEEAATSIAVAGD
jgi:ATP-dependent Lhr-like helicase